MSKPKPNSSSSAGSRPWLRASRVGARGNNKRNAVQLMHMYNVQGNSLCRQLKTCFISASSTCHMLMSLPTLCVNSTGFWQPAMGNSEDVKTRPMLVESKHAQREHLGSLGYLPLLDKCSAANTLKNNLFFRCLEKLPAEFKSQMEGRRLPRGCRGIGVLDWALLGCCSGTSSPVLTPSAGPPLVIFQLPHIRASLPSPKSDRPWLGTCPWTSSRLATSRICQNASHFLLRAPVVQTGLKEKRRGLQSQPTQPHATWRSWQGLHVRGSKQHSRRTARHLPKQLPCHLP